MPVFRHTLINFNIISSEKLKEQQKEKLKTNMDATSTNCKNTPTTIDAIKNDNNIALTGKHHAIIYSVLKNTLPLEQVEEYLKNYDNKQSTEYRRILCT